MELPDAGAEPGPGGAGPEASAKVRASLLWLSASRDLWHREHMICKWYAGCKSKLFKIQSSNNYFCLRSCQGVPKHSCFTSIWPATFFWGQLILPLCRPRFRTKDERPSLRPNQCGTLSDLFLVVLMHSVHCMHWVQMIRSMHMVSHGASDCEWDLVAKSKERLMHRDVKCTDLWCG